jgi:quinol-cytochrome oxidoreductase complex cytochrome b subunit
VAQGEVGILKALGRAVRVPVSPRTRGWLAFGWVLVILLVTQTVTGILLSFYYQASPRMAPQSVQFLMRDVDWGWLIRGIHHWASYLMVAVCALQLLRVFAAGSYRGSRRGVWCCGLVLALLVLALHVTGDLLTWDREAHATATRLLAAVERVPAIGGSLALLLRGGQEVTAATLGRVHAAHVAFFPFLVYALLALNLWYLVRLRRVRAEEVA